MVEIPDRLECLFSASIDQHGDSYSIEIPQDELEQRTIASDETYRVAVLPSTSQDGDTDTSQQGGSAPSTDTVERDPQTPPVSEGDVREVTIETIGDQGDGIAKIDRGYVVIVPGARLDDEVTVEITQARENVAFAQVRTDESMSDTPSDEESFEDTDDTLDEG
jgi:predicted RNA-binding protein with TRAM domain